MRGLGEPVASWFNSFRAIFQRKRPTVLKSIWTFISIGAAVSFVSAALAQAPVGPDAKKPTGGEPPGNAAAPPARRDDPFRGFGDTSSFDEVKAQIHASDEEWKVIGPKIRKVMAARRTADSGLTSNSPNGAFGFGFGFDPGRFGPGRGPQGNNRPAGGPGFGRDSFDAPGTRPGPGPGTRPGPDAGPGPGAGPGGPPGFGPPGFGPPGFGPPGIGPPTPDKEADKASPTRKPLEKPTAANGDSLAEKSPNPGPAGVPPGGPPTAKVPGTAQGVPGTAREPAKNDRPDPTRRAGPPPGFGGQSNPVTRAMAELQTMAADEKASTDQIQQKIAAVRKAREKARADLKAAESDLRQLVTPEQEAMLIALGYLE